MISKLNCIKNILRNKKLLIYILLLFMTILFSCNNKTDLNNKDNDQILDSSSETINNEDEKEEDVDKTKLYVGNTFYVKTKIYEKGDYGSYYSSNDKDTVEFIITDFDEEKVLVTTKNDYNIEYNESNNSDNWKDRYKCCFDFSEVYTNNELPLHLDSLSIANVIKNEDTDSDIFISSIEDIITEDYHKNGEKYFKCRFSLFFKRKYVEDILSGFYDKKNKLNEEIKNKYKNEAVEVSFDGKTAFVKDYIGGKLDKEKYGKYEILDFSKNESDFILDTNEMFAMFYNIDMYGDEIEDETIKTKEVILNGLNLKNCYSIDRMFSNSNIEKVDFTGVDLSNVYSAYKLFNECPKLISVKGLNLKSENLTNLRGAFFKCTSLTNLDIIDIDTKKVVDMAYMFYRCQNLENIDLSKFNTKNVKDMSYAFGNMRKLKKIDLSNFDTSKTTNMTHMFYRCESLDELNLSNFDTKNVNNMSYMFYCCYNLKKIDISSFDIKNCNNFSYFLYFCNNLTELEFDNFKNDNRIIECSYMFRYCENLTTLNMKNANLPYLYGKYIFDGCINLTNYNFDTDSLNNVKDNESNIFDNFLSTGEIDNEILYRVEENTDDLSNMYDWYGDIAKWTLRDNVENIKKQIDDLNINKELVKYVDRKKNISNRDIMFIQNNAWEKLLKNEFLVKKEYQYMEFYNYYEETRYNHFPNFVTADSMLHTYHLYFDYIMKTIEKTTMLDKVLKFSKDMLNISKLNYEKCKGSIYEEYAKTVVSYFTVPCVLLDENTNVDLYVKDIVEDEIDKINNTTYIGKRPLFNEYFKEDYQISMFNEDYTQYKPRGHYVDDEDLEKYFKALMWYGRTNFATDYDELNKCALLITSYISQNDLIKDYNDIKNIIYYFAGESDDNSVDEYMTVIKNIYGDTSVQNIINNNNLYNSFKEEIKKLKNSHINSSPLMLNSSENNVNFRLIGQTYTYDEDIFTNMMYDKILKNINGDKRYLPDFLDIPASLNSDIALKILTEEGKTDYPNYMDTISGFRKEMVNNIKNNNKNILYNKWLKALYCLIALEKNDEKLPSFMKNDEWKKKTLETFAGSFAELKHDTILYSKSAFGASECGEGGEDEFYDTEEYEIDDKGYVEPVSELYKELSNMAIDMKTHFSSLNLLTETDIEFLDSFSDLAISLETISNKELNNVDLTDDEFKLIEGYGATIEHLIIDSGAYQYRPDAKYYDYAPQPSSAIIADIATGDKSIGDFKALEVATGNPIRIFVLVNVGGKYKICQGAVYDFYQFEVDPNNRMNDIEWRTEMGFDTGYRKTKDGKIVNWNENFEDWGISYESEDGEELKESDFLPIDTKNVDFKFQEWTNSYKEKGLMFSERINTYYIDHCDSYTDKNICVGYEVD